MGETPPNDDATFSHEGHNKDIIFSLSFTPFEALTQGSDLYLRHKWRGFRSEDFGKIMIDAVRHYIKIGVPLQAETKEKKLDIPANVCYHTA